MKKLVSAALVLLTVAAAAFFILKVRGSGPERSRAMELAPVETILFVHAPDLRETARHFRKTDLFAIWREREMQEFLEKPRKTAPWMQQWEQRLALLGRVAPGEAFLAVTSLEGPQPRFVAGFAFAGKRREAEALLAEPREDFKRRWPMGTSGSASHKGAAITIFNYPEGVLAECFVRNWHFVASDTTLLRATLDRYENASAPAAEALVGSEVFQNATGPLGSGADLMLFGRVSAFGGRVGALLPAVAQPANPIGESDPKQVQTIAASTRIEGTQMRDTVFISRTGGAKASPLSRRTLALSGSETLLYFAMEMASLTGVFESAGFLAAVLPGVAAIEESLAERKLGWSDFGAAFGPEMGTTIGWPEDAAMPAMLLGLEVRDAAKARGFVEAITAGAAGAPGWSRKEEGGVSYFSALVEEDALVSPTIAMTPRFALLGFSAETVSAGLHRMDATNDGSVKDSPFQEAAKRLAVSTSGFGYLDAAALFERAYRALRPALTMSLAFSGDLGDYIDAGKLPSAERISTHLKRSVFTQSETTNGVLLESAGTLTFNQLIMGSIAAAVTAFTPGGTPAEAPVSPNAAPDVPASKPGGLGELARPVVAPPDERARSDADSAKQQETAIPTGR